MSGGNQRSRSFTTVILDLDFVAALLLVCTPLLQRYPTKLPARPRASFVLAPYFLRRAPSKHGLSVVSIFREIRVEPKRPRFFDQSRESRLPARFQKAVPFSHFLRTEFANASQPPSKRIRRESRVREPTRMSETTTQAFQLRTRAPSDWRSTGSEQGEWQIARFTTRRWKTGRAESCRDSFASHGHRVFPTYLRKRGPIVSNGAALIGEKIGRVLTHETRRERTKGTERILELTRITRSGNVKC